MRQSVERLRTTAARALTRLRPVPAVATGTGLALLGASSASGGVATRPVASSHHYQFQTPPGPVMLFPADDEALTEADQPLPAVPVPPAPAAAVPPAAAAAPGVVSSILRSPAATPPPTPTPAPPPSRLLIDGCSWAPMIPICDPRLNVYSNSNGQHSCGELVERWLRWAWNEPPVGGTAESLWWQGPGLPVPLAQHADGGDDAPQFGDVMVFASTPQLPSGHTGVVAGFHRSRGRDYVDMVEQNASSSGMISFPMSGSTVIPEGRTSLYGWLRPAIAGPVPRPDIPVSISASWRGGSNVWGGRSAIFDGPSNATVTGYWSGYKCLRLRHVEPTGFDYQITSCYWDGATVTMPDPPSDIQGRYTAAIEDAPEPPLNSGPSSG